MRKVYTYDDISKLDRIPCFDELKKIPWITATGTMSKALNSFEGFRLNQRAICFSSILQEIVPGWKGQPDRIRRAILTGEYLRKKIKESNNQKERRWLSNCYRMKNDIVAAITLLTESGIEPTDIISDDKDVHLMTDVWNFLLSDDDTLKSFNIKIDGLKNIDGGKSGFESAINRFFKNLDSKTLLLIGFYFITPLQKRIIDIAEEYGFDLVFLINYNWNHPYSNMIWEETFSEQYGFPSKKEWIGESIDDSNPLGRLLEGKNIDSSSVRIKKHETVLDLVHNIAREMGIGQRFYSPDQKTTDDVLKDFFPDEYGQMRLESYPAGKFLSVMHDMWDEETEDIALDMDALKSCFSTGWINANGVNSSAVMDVLERLGSYFDDCKTVEEWETRLRHLSQSNRSIVDSFEHESDDRWDVVMSNPFLNIGPFSIDCERIDTVIEMIEAVIHVAHELFDSKPRCIEDHLNLMDRILLEHDSPDNHDEYLMMSEFINRIKKHGDDRLFDPCDLKELATIFLKERPERPEDFGSAGVVSPLRDVDCSALMKSGTHIVMCDLERMPGSTQHYRWPLNQKVMDDISANVKPYKRDLINVQKHVLDASPLSNRYLLYVSLNNRNTVISWVHDLDDKMYPPSPFIKVLSELGNIPVDDTLHDELTMTWVNSIVPRFKNLGDFDIRKTAFVPNEAKMDYSLCPLRFLYGYVLDRNPSYSSDFHLQFVITKLISSFVTLNPSNKDAVQNKIMDLFPNLNNMEKRQMLDFVHRLEEDGTTDYNGYRYTNLRYEVCFPQVDLLNQANTQFDTLYSPRGRTGMDTSQPTEFKNVCKYCQHENYCIRTIYSLDQEDNYGR